MSDVQNAEPIQDWVVDEISKEMEPDVFDAVPTVDELRAAEDAEREQEEGGEKPAEPEIVPGFSLKDGKFLSLDSLDPDAVITFKDGGQCTVADCLNGGMRQSDYTKKTQRLGAMTKQAEQHTAINKQWSTCALALAHFADHVIKAALPGKPDIRLAETDSHAYLVAKDAYERAQETIKSLSTMAGQVMQFAAINNAQDVERMHERAREAFVKKRPHLRDQHVFHRAQRDASDMLARYGVDISEVPPDPRVYEMVHDFAQRVALETRRGPSRPSGGPKVQQPGARRIGNGTGEWKAKQAAFNHLSRTGDMNAGAAVIEDILQSRPSRGGK